MPSFTGTILDDTLPGSLGADTLTGLQGDDLYIVNNIGDVVVEGYNSGIDTIRTSVLDLLGFFSLAPTPEVENLSYTGTLAARLRGNVQSNLISGNAATSTSDTLDGNDGNDTLNGFGGNDRLIGGNGDDQLVGGTGDDTMIGGDGNDLYLVDSLLDRVVEFQNDGNDTIRSAVAKDLRVFQNVEGLVYTGATAATLSGNRLNNTITSQSATADKLFGFGGADVLDGGAGADTLNGGRGDDLYIAGVGDVVIETVDGGRDTVMEGLIFTGAVGAVLTGNDLNNMIAGGIGGDSASGGIGADTLLGGEGADSLAGGDGDDQLFGGTYYLLGGLAVPVGEDGSIDTLAGGTGNDRYQMSGLGDVIVEQAGGGVMDAVVASVNFSLAGIANVEALLLREGTLAEIGLGGDGNDVLIGNSLSNQMEGRAGNDTITGGGATFYGYNVIDVLDGGAGDDVLLNDNNAYCSVAMFGGAGNDLYLVSNSYGTSVVDSGGSDTVIFVQSGSLEQSTGVERIIMVGYDAAVDAAAQAAVAAVTLARNDGVTPPSFSQYAIVRAGGSSSQIFGNDVQNSIYGDDGNDTIDAGGGLDTVEGGDGDDTLILEADTPASPYYGTFDVIFGDSKTDTEAAGADRFRVETVTGANAALETFSGSGSFVFASAPMVADFEQGIDKISVARALVGDGDAVIDGSQVVSDPSGSFLAADELVFFRTDLSQAMVASFGYYPILQPVSAAGVDGVIGTASAAFAVGAERLFVLDDGTNSAVFRFVSANADATVSVDELSLLAVVSGVSGLTVSDFVFA